MKHLINWCVQNILFDSLLVKTPNKDSHLFEQNASKPTTMNWDKISVKYGFKNLKSM